MNQVVLIGRLTRDPELRYGAGTNFATCRFTLAVDRNLSREKRQEMESQNKPTADFISCVAFGKTAELIANYMSKGRQLAISGRIQTGSYQAQDGSTRYTTDVVCDRMEFIGSKNENAGGNFNQGGFTNNFDQGGFKNDFNQSSNDGFGIGDDAFPVDDADIPF